MMECLTSDIYDAALKVISEVQSHPLHINNCVISALVGDILTVIAIQSTYIGPDMFTCCRANIP